MLGDACVWVCLKQDLARDRAGGGQPAALTARRDAGVTEEPGALGEGSGDPVCGAWRAPGTRPESRWEEK